MLRTMPRISSTLGPPRDTIQPMTKHIRHDSRSPSDLRAIKNPCCHFTHAPGSVLIAFGNTQVRCARR